MSSQQTGQPAKPGKRSYDLDVKNERPHNVLTMLDSECDDQQLACLIQQQSLIREQGRTCLLYTSDAADE